MLIVFHLGLLKTGTSYIQQMLRVNRVNWPDVCVVSYEGPSKDCRVSGQAFCGSGDPRLRAPFHQDLTRLRAHIESSHASTAIVSDENICLRTAFDGSEHMFTWLQRGVEDIAQVFDGHDLKFVLGHRSRDTWLPSLYAQVVKRAGETREYTTWKAACPFTDDVLTFIEQLAERTGQDVRPISYEAEVARGRLGEGLLKTAGLSDDRCDSVVYPSEVINKRLKQSSLAFMRAVNRASFGDRTRIRISELVESMPEVFSDDAPASLSGIGSRSGVEKMPAYPKTRRIRAHMATYPQREEVLPIALESICGQVDQVYLCLNEYTEPPGFLARFPNVVAQIPDRDFKDVGKFIFPVEDDDIVFLVDDDLVYAKDYVSWFGKAFPSDEFERGAFGLHGISYMEAEDGSIQRKLPVRHFRRKFPSTLRVDQLGTGTVMVSGRHLPTLDDMIGSERFVDVRFARLLFERGLPLWSLRRRARLVDDPDKERLSETIFQTFTVNAPPHVDAEIASFATQAPHLGISLRAYRERIEQQEKGQKGVALRN